MRPFRAWLLGPLFAGLAVLLLPAAASAACTTHTGRPVAASDADTIAELATLADICNAISGGGSGGGGVVTVTPTDRAGTITTGGTAQTAIAANASRKGWCIQNPPGATESLQVRSGAAATATTGVTVPAGQQACNPPGIVDVGIVSVFAATTNHKWQGTEYQ